MPPLHDLHPGTQPLLGAVPLAAAAGYVGDGSWVGFGLRDSGSWGLGLWQLRMSCLRLMIFGLRVEDIKLGFLGLTV